MFKYAIPIILSLVYYRSSGQVNQFVAFHKYTQSEGLSSYNITKIIQDPYGFIWAGTQDGLNRFDGVRFFSYNKQGDRKYRIAGSNVTDIKADPKRNLLWVTTSYGGVSGISLQTLSIIHKIDRIDNVEFADRWIRAVQVVGDNLWVGGNGVLLAFRISDRQQVPVSKHGFAIYDSLLNVSQLHCDAFNRIWAFCNNQGLLVFEGGSGKLVEHIPIDQLRKSSVNADLNVWQLATPNESEVWAATSAGLIRFYVSREHVTVLKNDYDLPFSSTGIFGCTVDKKGDLWYSTATKFLRYDLNARRVTEISDAGVRSDAWNSTIYQLFSDSENNIWIGSQEGLAYFGMGKKVFTPYHRSLTSDVFIPHAYTIFPFNDSVIYCGATDGLYKVNTQLRSMARISPGEYYFLIRSLPDGHVIVSHSLGLFVLRKDKLIPVSEVYPFLAPIQHELFNSLVIVNDSLVLMGSQFRTGLYLVDFGKKNVVRFNNEQHSLGLNTNIINAVFQDKQHNVWVLSESMLLHFDPITYKHKPLVLKDPVTGKRCSIFFDMCETAHSYWFAAYGTGLVETDKQLVVKRIISDDQGLCNNGVYKIFSYDDSLVIATSNNGISVVAEGSQDVKNYYQEDGLHADAFESFCGYQDKEVIYAGGLNGFTAIEPRMFAANQIAPRLYFTQIKTETGASVQDTSNLLLERQVIPNNWLQTTVSFSGLNFSNPSRVTYQYKIKEIDSAWINIGNRNFVSIIGLPAGSYTLEVMAANEDGVWCEPKALTLIFLPKWYQTWWFRSLIVLAIMGGLYGLYRYRLWQIRQEQQMRQRIASDLHDDIGSTLNSVKVFANLALMKPEQNTTYLSQLKEGVQGAIVGVRDMVWILDDKQDTIEHLIGRVEQFIYPLVAAQEIQFEKYIDPTAAGYLLKKEEKRNLYLIMKEALNNSIKYANASLLRLRVERLSQAQFVVIIADDGKGFNIDTVQKGNGLNNLHFRARQIRYRIEISSAPGAGTTIRLFNR